MLLGPCGNQINNILLIFCKFTFASYDHLINVFNSSPVEFFFSMCKELTV